MRMSRQIADQAIGGLRVAEQDMRRFGYRDGLKIAIRARMIVRPKNIVRLRVVRDMPRRIWLRAFAVKIMGTADAAQGADRAAEIHMVARDEQAAALLPEPADRCAIFAGQSVARIDCKEPEFVEVRPVDGRKDRIGRARHGSVACGHLAAAVGRHSP